MTSFSYDASAFGNEETPLNANVLISQSPSAVQHIVAMAVVKAIKQLSPVDVAVSIKWPNDIYYNRQVKLGGVLVNAECDSDMNMKFTVSSQCLHSCSPIQDLGKFWKYWISNRPYQTNRRFIHGAYLECSKGFPRRTKIRGTENLV